MGYPDGAAENLLLSAESLVFYGITASGTLQARELFRFMEHTGPQWWLPVAGMTRQEFWSRHRIALVARHTTIRTLEGGCRPNDKVVVEHLIRHGTRDRPNGPPEYGFVDIVRVRRESDGVIVSDLTVDTVWLRLQDGMPQVVTAPPPGLNCPVEQLPTVPPPPSLNTADPCSGFTWTLRETDIANGHVSFPSYFERAENSLSDAGQSLPYRPVWQGWYRQQCFNGERMKLAVREDGDTFVLAFAGESEHRPRVLVTVTHGTSEPAHPA